MRFLVAIVFGIAALAAGYLVLLNDAPVVVHFGTRYSTTAPLAIALLAAFGVGASLVTLVAGAGAVTRSIRAWRVRRRARREVLKSERTAQARELLWTGAPAEARATLKRAGRDLDNDVAHLALLAETHLEEDDAEGARALLKDALPRVGPDPRLLDLLAEASMRLGDSAAAVEALERARLGRPASPRLLRRLRDLHVAAGRWDAALPLQAEIVLHRHSSTGLEAETALLRGIKYELTLAHAEDDPARAARELRTLTREAKEFVPAWVTAGDFLVRTGRPLRARWLWERGLRRTGSAVLAERLAALNGTENHPERTIRALRRAHGRRPDDQRLTALLARELLAAGRVEQAQALLEVDAMSPSATLARAELAHRQGNPERALELFRQAAYDTTAGYVCATCRHPSAAWAGACTACRRWGTLVPC